VAIALAAGTAKLVVLALAFLFLAMPIGSAYASLQLILPNQVRGQIGALQVFALNFFGLILGPPSRGFSTTTFFETADDRLVARDHGGGRFPRVGDPVPATFAPYRRDYARMHGGR
jgi:hypothetical protein